ncbi:His Kinase A (phospho-acceptor) domain-containing protein [Chitinophaga sp. YR573]|uniref:sensor histidine kinase n=1 Tax=Chitinophaga sp. YR573 TaxID=1881040 RepID=UPI0008D2CD1F|nr:response regulator [Chitinophaga sp. YR573]SEW07371.1 His Kinase A (phospho-acceptor) domain-containing protein [Chitinophaga sp. YR573]
MLEQQDPIKILVVDDRADNLMSIESILERESYIIVKANSGRAALKILLKEFDFSLILMDVQMPDMNGFETAALIYQRDRLKDVPIIFITAHNEDEAIFKGYKVGAVDFIYKPVNPELLRIKVGLFVELYRKTQSLIAQEQKLLNTNASLQKEIEEREASERKIRELNRQLIQNNIHLKTVNEELDRFAYIASHDLQEPLRKIRVFSDMIIQKKTGTDDVDKYVTKITNATIRMQQLVSDLLRFSRHSIQGGDFVSADLNDIVKEAVNELEIKIQQTNARIIIDPLPAVSAIPILMRQVFYNLISNALKFRKKEVTPEIHIYAEQEKHPEIADCYYYRIFVKDNGIGFESQYSDDIFIVFKRLHSYHEIEGTGIGLSICKKIMEQHNGSIKATSEIDHGATFIVGIPEKQQTASSLPMFN